MIASFLPLVIHYHTFISKILFSKVNQDRLNGLTSVLYKTKFKNMHVEEILVKGSKKTNFSADFEI
jgi:hypothetical protein